MTKAYWRAVLAPLGVPNEHDNRELSSACFVAERRDSCPLIHDGMSFDKPIGAVDLVSLDAGDEYRLFVAAGWVDAGDEVIEGMRSGALRPGFALDGVDDRFRVVFAGRLTYVRAEPAALSMWPEVARFEITDGPS